MKKLEDTVAACNIIRSGRSYSRRAYTQKSIYIKIDQDLPFYAETKIQVNRFTGNVSLSNCLQYGSRVKIFPTTNQKLRCTNQHALDMLETKRVYWRERTRRKKERGLHPL